MSAAVQRIPVTLLTGFLGAGKTTVLNHLLRQPALAGTVVLVNEFGAVAIDHLLVERLAEDIVLLPSGCICCSVRGDLTRSLRDLFMRRLRRELPALARIVIETTGLADPAPVIFSLMQDFFIAERYRLDGVVTVVDGMFGAEQLEREACAVKQVAMADRLVITKTDQAGDVSALAEHLAQINPGATQVVAACGVVDAAALLDCGLWNPATRSADATRWLAAEATEAVSWARPAAARHGSARSFVVRIADPVEWSDFSIALDMLQELWGEQILRVKGIVQVRGEALPRVLQCVHHLRYPDAALPAWPDAERDTRLVFIVRDLDRAIVDQAFAALCGEPSA